MAHAEKCPVCYGTGKLSGNGILTEAVEPVCHGCDGKGWIEVQDDPPILTSDSSVFVTND